MYLGMNGGGCVKRFGRKKALAMLKAAGFDAVDWGFDYYESDWLLEDDYLEQAAQIRKDIDEAGLVCRQTHAPFEGGTYYRGLRYGDPFTEDFPEYLKTIRAMEVSVILGAGHTVVHDLDVPEGVDNLESNYPFYKSLQPYAEKYNIQVAIENLPTNKYLAKRVFPDRIGTAEKLNELLRRLDSDRFVVLVDTGHAQLTNVMPQDLIRGLKPGCLKGLHIQDADESGDRHLLPFMDDVKWDEVLKALKETGYNGDFHFEVVTGEVPDELMEDFLRYAGRVGRYLIKRFNEI